MNPGTENLIPGCRTPQRPRVFLHDRRSGVTFGVEQVPHPQAVQVAFVYAGNGLSAPHLLEVDDLNHVQGQRVQFRQRVGIGEAAQLVGGVGAQAEPCSGSFWNHAPHLFNQHGHVADRQRRVLHGHDHALPRGLRGEAGQTQGFLRDVAWRRPRPFYGRRVNHPEVGLSAADQFCASEGCLEHVAYRVDRLSQAGQGHCQVECQRGVGFDDGLKLIKIGPPVLSGPRFAFP